MPDTVIFKKRNGIALIGAILLLFFITGAAFAEKTSEDAKIMQGFFANPETQKTNFKRIAVLFPQAIGVIYLLGAQNEVAGLPIAKLNISMHDGGFYKCIDPNALSKSDIGFPGKVNMENIVSINPDLLIEPSFQLKVEEHIKKLNCSTYKLYGTFSNVGQWLDAVLKTGELLNKKEKSRAYFKYFNEKINFVKTRLAQSHGVKSVKVLHITQAGGKIFTHGRKSSFVKDMLKICGCDVFGYGDISAMEYPISKEDVLKFDPEVIICEEINHAAFKQSIDLKDEFWSKLRAYRENKIYSVPVDDNACFLTDWYFNAAAPLGLLWTAKTIHPEAFKDVDLDGEAQKFYKSFFGIDVMNMRSANKNIIIKGKQVK